MGDIDYTFGSVYFPPNGSPPSVSEALYEYLHSAFTSLHARTDLVVGIDANAHLDPLMPHVGPCGMDPSTTMAAYSYKYLSHFTLQQSTHNKLPHAFYCECSHAPYWS